MFWGEIGECSTGCRVAPDEECRGNGKTGESWLRNACGDVPNAPLELVLSPGKRVSI